MLRAIGAFLVFLASAGMGCQESRKLSEHIQALEGYLQVIICLKGEIRYGLSSLPDAFYEAAMHCSERYAVFLKTVSEKMENRQEEDPEGLYANVQWNISEKMRCQQKKRNG